MGIVLDSSIIIAAERRGHTVREILEQVKAAQGEIEIGVSVVTIAELVHGAYRTKTQAQQQRRLEFIERLAPYAVTTHLKDMAVDEAPDGFLLSEMVMGTGMLDMKRVISTIQNARPKTNLLLEMITRDPLRVPCLTDKYWTTFPDRKGIYLAKTLRLVREKRQKLPLISVLDHEAQLKVEEENVKRCLAFA